MQVLSPLLQGLVWSLAQHGWRYWNRSAQLNGSSVGAKIRRWWYRTNNWPVTDREDTKLAADVGDVSWARSGNEPCFTDVM